MSGYAKRVAIVLAFVLACSTFTGAAFAGDGNGNGNSGNAPGQEKKAEESQQPVAPPGQVKKQEEQAPAPAVHTEAKQPSSPGKSGAARGQAKKAEKVSTGNAATVSKSTRSKRAEEQAEKAATRATVRAQSESQGNSAIARQHVIICHRTGSETNPYVVINISRSAWERAHKPGGHPTLDGRDDIVLAGPSRAVRPGSKGGFDKSDCPAPVVHAPAPPVTHEVVTHAVTHQPTVTVTSAAAVQPTAGVAGAQVAIARPKAHQRGGAGGVLGALARVGRGGELPFTGIPLWIAALAAFALLGGGFAVRRATL